MSHTGAPGLVHHPISTYTASSEPPSVITRYSTLAPDAAYASSGEETSLASFEIFSAAAGLRARSETAGTTSPRLKAGRSPPQCSRAPLDALLCRDAPKPIFTGNIPSLSAQNSPRTASQRVRSIAHSAKVVIFACAQPRPLTLSRWSAIFGHAPASLAAYGILVRYPLATSSLRLAALARGWEKRVCELIAGATRLSDCGKYSRGQQLRVARAAAVNSAPEQLRSDSCQRSRKTRRVACPVF